MLIGNYHTHTTRCNHAVGTDEEYVQAAIAAGYKKLGMSDHGPFPDERWSHSRMDFRELPEYIETFRMLDEKYADEIALYVGLEIEYDASMHAYYEQLYNVYGLDYLAFGNHDFQLANGTWHDAFHTETPEVLEAYTKNLVAGMATDYFAFVVHPDVAFDRYPRWDAAAERCSEQIIDMAVKRNIVLEYNANGIRKGKHQYEDEERYGYPHHRFWELVASAGVRTMIGSDAHNPAFLWDEAMIESFETVSALGLPIVDDINIILK